MKLHNILLSIMLMGVLVLGMVTPSQSQMPVIDAAAIAKLVEEIGILANQLRVLRDQLEDMKRNSTVGSPEWDSATAQLLRLLAELGEATSVLYTHDGSQDVWEETYTEDAAVTDGTWLEQERARSHATIGTQRDLLRLLEERRRAVEDDAARMEALQAELAHAIGRNHILQVSGKIQAEQAWRLARLEELISILANSQIVGAVAETNEKAAREAMERSFMENHGKEPKLYPWTDEGLL